jgi:TPR repeat protein
MNMLRHLKFSKTKFAAFAALSLGLHAGLLTSVYSQTKPAKKYTKPLEGPNLDGPIVAGRGSDIEQTETDKAAPGDIAYGAYQRGYYLTALNLALPLADSGDPAAQTLIGELYWNGFGVARDRKKAIEWYEFAANAGNREAQFIYGNLLLRGQFIKEDKTAGEAFLRKAAESGHARAQFNFAQIITARRPTWSGFKAALPWYEKAAESGLADAQYAMSNIYAEARGVTFNDDKKARFWLEKSANNGYDSAQVELGIWYANGRGGEKSEQQALFWFARAASKGNVIAQNRLARMYSFGVGTKVDDVRAGAWHVLARRAGFSDSVMDRRFATLSKINKQRAIELANRLTKRVGS